MRILLYISITAFCLFSLAQSVVVSETESSADATAILDVQSSAKGLLIPRMTLSDRIDIEDPATGLFVYQTDDVAGFYSYDGSSWSYLVNSSQITDFGSGAVITASERDALESAIQTETDPIYSVSAASELTSDEVTALKSLVNDRRSVPSGTIVPFGGVKENIPDGWLFCDGQVYAQTTYPDLFDAIGIAWGGSGDVFNVPDLRGYFLRGVDDGEGIDSDAASRTDRAGDDTLGDVVGSYQSDAFQGHWHLLGDGSTGESGLTRGFVTGSGCCYEPK